MPLHVFLHVPKTAGSSLRTVLSREYGARRIFYHDLPAEDPRPFSDIGAELRHRMSGATIRLVTGHQIFGIHQALCVPCQYFTLLRDPIERALSEYFYAFTYPHHRLKQEITSGALSPLEFLTSPAHGQGAAQAAQIAGRAPGDPRDAAILHLEHAFAAVGLAEDFERSLLLFARRLGWAPPLFIARNVTKLTPALAAQRASAREAVQAHRALYAVDDAVHLAARARFAADLAEEGPAFETAFQAYARLQAELAARAGDTVYERYEFLADDTLPPWARELAASDDHRAVRAFLKAPPVQRRPIHNYCGAIAAVADGVLHGWALDLADPAPVVVRLHGPRGPIAATRAQRRHPPGLGALGEFSAFRLPLPRGEGPLRLTFGETPMTVPDPTGALAAWA